MIPLSSSSTSLLVYYSFSFTLISWVHILDSRSPKRGHVCSVSFRVGDISACALFNLTSFCFVEMCLYSCVPCMVSRHVGCVLSSFHGVWWITATCVLPPCILAHLFSCLFFRHWDFLVRWFILDTCLLVCHLFCFPAIAQCTKITHLLILMFFLLARSSGHF